MPGIVFVNTPNLPLFGGGIRTINLQIPGTNLAAFVLDILLINGTTTITVPSSAVAALIIPSPTNTFQITYGLDATHLNAISRVLPTMVTFDLTAPPASFVLGSTSAIQVEVVFW